MHIIVIHSINGGQEAAFMCNLHVDNVPYMRDILGNLVPAVSYMRANYLNDTGYLRYSKEPVKACMSYAKKLGYTHAKLVDDNEQQIGKIIKL